MSARKGRIRSTTETAAVLNDVSLLHRNRGFRDRQGTFFVEGVRNFVRAIDHGFVFERILFSDKLLINPLARKFVRHCRRTGVPTIGLSPEEYRGLSTTKRASGVAAIVRQKWTKLADVSTDQHMCWVVLETVQSPGNFGTLIRSSSAAGGAGFILVGKHVDPYVPAVVRSAMGAVFQQRFVRTNWASMQEWVAKSNCAVIGATPKAREALHAFECPVGPPLLVLGEERKGLSAQQEALCSHFVRIPMQEGTDSLNLGVAGSLLIYEVLRRRTVVEG